MRKILVGFDGSEPARHALEKAAELARLSGGTITVLTAAADRLVREDGVVTMAADEDAGMEVAESGADYLRSLGLEAVQARVSVGAPDDALVLEAGDGYDLVVVGHRSHGPLEELFVGSTAKSVVDRACCTVMVVR